MAVNPDNPNGVGESAPESALDLSDGRDRALLRRAVAERWPIPMNRREKIASQLIETASGEGAAAKKQDGTPDGRAIASAARTLARMDALNQADEHADRHYSRIDEGKPTDLVRHDSVEIVVPGMK